MGRKILIFCLGMCLFGQNLLGASNQHPTAIPRQCETNDLKRCCNFSSDGSSSSFLGPLRAWQEIPDPALTEDGMARIIVSLDSNFRRANKSP